MPRGIIPQNFRSLGFAVSEELGNIQTDSLTHSLTDWCFDREITHYFQPKYYISFRFFKIPFNGLLRIYDWRLINHFCLSIHLFHSIYFLIIFIQETLSGITRTSNSSVWHLLPQDPGQGVNQCQDLHQGQVQVFNNNIHKLRICHLSLFSTEHILSLFFFNLRYLCW